MVVPRRSLASQDYAAKYGARWVPVYPAERVQRKEPQQYGRRAANFGPKVENELPELGVLEMERGYLVGEHGWVVTDTAHLLPDHSWYGRRHLAELVVPRKAYEVRRIAGACLSLASDWACVNYGHFLLDGLSRLNLFLKAGYSLEDVDYVYCSAPTASATRLLERAGIELKKCVWAERGVAIQPDRVVVPSFPGARRNYPCWVPDFLRRTLLANQVRPWRRLYIPRGGSRKVVNEGALVALLSKIGFEIFDPSTHSDPPGRFSEAAVVIGAHGAGLADIAFCQPGAVVLELMPSDHVWPYWYTLADAGRLHYGYIIGQSLVERDPRELGPSPYDFAVDEGEFRSALSVILKASERTRWQDAYPEDRAGAMSPLSGGHRLE